LLARKGALRQSFTNSNVLVSVTSAYFVVTALTAEPFTAAPMRALPILLVFVAMFYWMWRVRRVATPRLDIRPQRQRPAI
jgi:hypothetical protein